MKGSYLGPQYLKNEIKNELDKCGAKYLSLNKNKMIDIVTNELISKKLLDGYKVEWSLDQELLVQEVL